MNPVKVNAMAFGGGRPLVLIAGPCVIEDEGLTLRIAERLKQITAELGRYGLAPHHQVIRQGDPGEQILEYANDIHAELIVMGSHGSSGVLRLMLGSASQRVVDNARCPVLVARIQSARNR